MDYSQLTFKRVHYNGDWVDSFDINSRFHGYTRDKQSFHVYDEQRNEYKSYYRAEFESFLRSLDSQGNSQTQYSGNENIIPQFQQPSFNVGKFNAGPIVLIGGLLMIAWLIIKD